MDQTLTVRFTPEKENYVRATRALARKSPGFMVLAAILGVAVIVALVVLLVPGFGEESWDSMALMVILVGAFYLLYFVLLVPVQFSRNYKKNKYLQMERTFIINDEHLVMNVGDKSSELHWENFQKVIDGGDFFLLIYKAQERFYPFILKAAFEGPQALNAFLKLLEEKSIPVK
jgi:hypothetical protein